MSRRKRTGGGTFQNGPGPVYFFAGQGATIDSPAEYSLIALNELIDNNTQREEMLRRISLGGKVFLDSGVFNLANQHAIKHGMTMDEALSLHPNDVDGFATLREHYVATVREHEADLWGYVELDQGGRERKRETRAALEAEGVRPIPVYHPMNDGWDYFDELCSEYDRICVGNVVQARRDVRRRLLSTLWERRRKYPSVWIHVLGLTPNELVGTLPFNSCDSSSFVGSLRYGAGASPYAVSALKKIATADATYSVADHAEQKYFASQMLHTATHHMSRAWKVQVDESNKLAPTLPKVRTWEAPLR